jgi:hypothetical protein
MKSYPSIARGFEEFDAYIFDKLDGSNLRMQWSRKKGWYKFGTRTRLFDSSDEIFGPAIGLFDNTLAKPLHDIAKAERYDELVVFCEFWGPNSFAGLHESSDEKQLTLFDAAPYKQGLLGPRDFLKLFGHLNIPKFLGKHNWTRGFVQQVRDGAIDGVTFEGVVGKAKEGRHDLIMRKAKTQAWVDKVKQRYSPEDAEKIISS